jgi:hypothetical protein|tara:strand:- start:144 stop:425 length:282 start_codon:yes stop_codon:yes gene_type:complete
MVKKAFCDRCGIELKEEEPHLTDFNEIFESVNDSFNEPLDGKEGLLKAQLCWDCSKGYEKIVKETNKKIKEYIKENKKEKKKSRKFGLFKIVD